MSLRCLSVTTLTPDLDPETLKSGDFHPRGPCVALQPFPLGPCEVLIGSIFYIVFVLLLGPDLQHEIRFQYKPRDGCCCEVVLVLFMPAFQGDLF